MFGKDDEKSDLEKIVDSLRDKARFGRDPESECDECGVSEGSVTVVRDWPGKADQRHLCRSCLNDPEVWPDE